MDHGVGWLGSWIVALGGSWIVDTIELLFCLVGGWNDRVVKRRVNDGVVVLISGG